MGKYVNGARIKELLRERGMNQMDLVRETGLGVNTISHIITRPEHDPYLSTLHEIARVLEVSVHEIITERR